MSRELDAQIAIALFGWQWFDGADGARYLRRADDRNYGAIERAGKRKYFLALLHYSTSITAAEAIINRMRDLGYYCQMRTPFEKDSERDYWAGFTPHSTTGWNGKPDHWTRAESLAEAICLAALAAATNTGEI